MYQGAKRKQGWPGVVRYEQARTWGLLSVFTILLHNEERGVIGVTITQQQQACKQAQFVKGSAVLTIILCHASAGKYRAVRWGCAEGL